MNSERRIVEKEIHRFALNNKLMVNCYAGYTVSERKFRKWREWTQITPFVIPNAVRNPVGKRKEILRLRSEWQING